MKYSLCPLTFGSELCGYHGPDRSCKKTLEDCALKGNVLHFQGAHIIEEYVLPTPKLPRSARPRTSPCPVCQLVGDGCDHPDTCPYVPRTAATLAQTDKLVDFLCGRLHRENEEGSHWRERALKAEQTLQSEWFQRATYKQQRDKFITLFSACFGLLQRTRNSLSMLSPNALNPHVDRFLSSVTRAGAAPPWQASAPSAEPYKQSA